MEQRDLNVIECQNEAESHPNTVELNKKEMKDFYNEKMHHSRCQINLFSNHR